MCLALLRYWAMHLAFVKPQFPWRKATFILHWTGCRMGLLEPPALVWAVLLLLLLVRLAILLLLAALTAILIATVNSDAS